MGSHWFTQIPVSGIVTVVRDDAVLMPMIAPQHFCSGIESHFCGHVRIKK